MSKVIKPKTELFLQVHITTDCNLSCRHCYMDEQRLHMSVQLFEIIVNQFKELSDNLRVSNMWVQLTGGEPLMHPQFCEFLEMSSAHFPTKVLTNGTLIDEEAAELLARYCQSVQVSFDGTKGIHDSWRGERSFEAAHRGLLALKAAGVRTSARVTAGKDNQNSIEDLLSQLAPDIDGFNISRVVPTGPCAVSLPDTDAYRKLIFSLYGAYRDNPKIKLRDPFFGPLLKVDSPGEDFTGCSAGISGLCVTETGDIYPCRRLPIKLGNVQTESLLDVYLNHPLLHRLRSRDLKGHCGKCEDKLNCGGSRCVAYALTGDPFAEDSGCIFV